jgi:hypothetical protein
LHYATILKTRAMERRVLSPRDACSPQASRTFRVYYLMIDHHPDILAGIGYLFSNKDGNTICPQPPPCRQFAVSY